MSMSMPFRSSPLFDAGPPNRSLEESKPLPVPLWVGGGVGLAAFGVGAAEEVDFGALTSAASFVVSHTGSRSMAPSRVDDEVSMGLVSTAWTAGATGKEKLAAADCGGEACGGGSNGGGG